MGFIYLQTQRFRVMKNQMAKARGPFLRGHRCVYGRGFGAWGLAKYKALENPTEKNSQYEITTGFTSSF